MLNAARVSEITTHGGTIISGASTVFINGQPAAISGGSIATCAATHAAASVCSGSGQVFIEGFPAARAGDVTGCGAVIASGSGNVFIG